MPVSLYMDVHVPQAITDQLRRRGVDVATAIEDGQDEIPDTDLMDRIISQGRVLFTQDSDFLAHASHWQSTGRFFSGVFYGHQLAGTIGDFVKDLEIIAKASESSEWANKEYLPFKS